MRIDIDGLEALTLAVTQTTESVMSDPGFTDIMQDPAVISALAGRVPIRFSGKLNEILNIITK